MKVIIALVLISILIASFSLNQVPVHLNQDELGFTLNAHSISMGGFDENNRFLPLYFWHLGVIWSTPIIVYLTSLFLLILPVSEIVIRLPSVLVGVVDLVLIYLIAKKVFKNKFYGLVAALLLFITPPHFIHSRLLLDNLYIVPFMLGWLLALLIYIEKKKLWYLFLATFLLGAGVHSYHAAKIMMSLYLVITLIFLFPEIKRQKISVLICLTGFFLPLLPLIPWLQQYPDTLTDQVKYTGLYDTNLSFLQGIATLLTWQNFTQKFGIFISYFNPAFLFISGDISLIHSTRKVGIFLLPYFILLPLGFWDILKNKGKRIGLLIILGFLSAPLAPAIVGNLYRVSKELVILAFAAIIATYGLKFLLTFGKFGKIFSMSLFLACFLQFGYFLYDYFGEYKTRSYSWFNYNIPGALETIIEEDTNDSLSNIYLDNQIYFIDRYWKFYALKHQKEDILLKTYYINPLEVEMGNLPTNSVLLYRYEHKQPQATFSPNILKVIEEPDGARSFYEIYIR